MSNPIAVLISDVHYNLQTLPLADAAMRQAIETANDLDVPLIVAGDLHDTKANLRAECVNAMLSTFKLCKVRPYIIIGNHCKINERGTDHALEFLNGTTNLVTSPTSIRLRNRNIYLAPYFSDKEAASSWFRGLLPGSTVVAHQGLTNSDAGEYIQDKSAVCFDDVAHLTVISGHYHTRQCIRTSDDPTTVSSSTRSDSTWSYIGNPYTLTFSEAADPEKGFLVLNDDSSLTFVPTNLRKHVVLECTIQTLREAASVVKPDDLVWIKLTGSKEELAQYTRAGIQQISGLESFKLDLFPLDTNTVVSSKPQLEQPELLDEIIDQSPNVSDEQKARLKSLWRKIDDKT